MQDILTVEGNFSAWLNLSIILLTASLVFYHMTKVVTIKIPKKVAGIISSGLILTNIIFTINSIIPYFTRTNKLDKNSNEKNYRNIYLITSIIFVMLEIIMCYYIIKDSFY
jgi:uncharacterized membrane protein YidH (DUF202 family)